MNFSVVSIVGYTSFTQRAKESNAKTELSQITTHIYAAAAIEGSKLSIGSDGVVVSVKDSGDVTSGEALEVLRDELGKGKDLSDTILNKLTILSEEAGTDGTVKVEKLYYNGDNCVAEWDVATNELKAYNEVTGLLTSSWSGLSA